MKKVLVTGGAGFIGSNFCNINKNKYEITALDNLFLGDERNLDPEFIVKPQLFRCHRAGMRHTLESFRQRQWTCKTMPNIPQSRRS